MHLTAVISGARTFFG